MVDEQLEFSISQYLDGQLSADEAAALEKRLAEDAEARALLEQYRRLDAMVKAPVVVPGIRWERVFRHISDAIDEDAQADRLRITTWLRSTVRVAAAALLAMAILLTAKLVLVDSTPPGAPVVRAVVEGPAAETATGQAVAIIEIAPPTLAQGGRRSADFYAIEDVISMPSRIVVIAGEGESGQDILK